MFRAHLKPPIFLKPDLKIDGAFGAYTPPLPRLPLSPAIDSGSSPRSTEISDRCVTFSIHSTEVRYVYQAHPHHECYTSFRSGPSVQSCVHSVKGTARFITLTSQRPSFAGQSFPTQPPSVRSVAWYLHFTMFNDHWIDRPIVFFPSAFHCSRRKR